MANVAAGEVKNLTRVISVGDDVAEGMYVITSEVFSGGDEIASAQITVSVKRPRILRIAPNLEIAIPQVEVLQAKTFYQINKVTKRVSGNAGFWMIALLVLVGLSYVYYRFRGG